MPALGLRLTPVQWEIQRLIFSTNLLEPACTPLQGQEHRSYLSVTQGQESLSRPWLALFGNSVHLPSSNPKLSSWVLLCSQCEPVRVAARSCFCGGPATCRPYLDNLPTQTCLQGGKERVVFAWHVEMRPPRCFLVCPHTYTSLSSYQQPITLVLHFAFPS